MTRTVVGLFNTVDEAHRAVEAIVREGVDREHISVIRRDEAAGASREESGGSGTTAGIATGAGLGALGGLLIGLSGVVIPGLGAVIAAGPVATMLVGAGVGAAAGGLVGALADMGLPEEEAEYYAEGVERGGTLVAVRTDEERAERVRSLMDRHGAVEVERLHADRTVPGEGRAMGGPPVAGQPTGEPAMAGPPPSAPIEPTAREETREAIPVAEEQIQVGKRRVQKGAVRVYTQVREQPVEEEVRLREQRARVERRPADRPVHAGEQPFREQSMEFTETGEEPVIAKRARIVEEVSIEADEGERTEVVRDAVRRTDVTVERSGQPAAAFQGAEADFRQHCERTFGPGARRYEDCAPAYRFGYDLGSHPGYGGGDWAGIEPEARRRWETRNEGTWEEFKDSIRYAWDRARGRAKAA